MTATDAMLEPAADEPTRGAILVTRGVTKRFGGLVANRDIDFDIPRRAIVSIIGPNGAGKTTFFNQLTGMMGPSEGTIEFNGLNIVGLGPHQIVELGIARTYQNIRLFNDMSVMGNVMVGRHTRMKARWWETDARAPEGRDRGGRDAGAGAELLELVGAPSTLRGRRGQEPAVRRPAPAGARAGAGQRSEAAAARRAHGRHEPRRDAADDALIRRIGRSWTSPSCSSSTT